jgi:hypothetical protein
MIVLCAGFAALLACPAGLGRAPLVLWGFAPGGIGEMGITAKVVQLGVPIVTAFQVCRRVAVLVPVEPPVPMDAGQCMTSGFCASSA